MCTRLPHPSGRVTQQCRLLMLQGEGRLQRSAGLPDHLPAQETCVQSHPTRSVFSPLSFSNLPRICMVECSSVRTPGHCSVRQQSRADLVSQRFLLGSANPFRTFHKGLREGERKSHSKCTFSAANRTHPSSSSSPCGRLLPKLQTGFSGRTR